MFAQDIVMLVELVVVPSYQFSHVFMLIIYASHSVFGLRKKCTKDMHVLTTFLYADKELDIIEMAVYGDVIRPGNSCRCRTMAEMLGRYKSKDNVAACKLPYPSESI